MVQLSQFFGKTLQEMTYANGATLVCQGVFNPIWMYASMEYLLSLKLLTSNRPFAVKYGRRPVYLFSNFLMAIACVWLGIASTRNYTVFIVGRAFLGAWEAPIESIVPSTITDIFFLHNRGELVSTYSLSILGGNELGPMFSAFIIQALGMNWAFIVAMFVGASVISMFFFMPETKYTGPRPRILPVLQSEKDEKTAKVSEIEDTEAIHKKTFVQDLKFWSKADPDVSLVRAFLRPFVLLAYPTVVWSCFIYGLALSWNVILGSIVAQLFAPLPYLFNSNAQGLFFLSPFIGSLVGVYLYC